MSYVLLQNIPYQFSDNNGHPLVGGTLEAYAFDGVTPIPMYADNIGTSAGTIITLDARGEPETIKAIWLDSKRAYKFKLKNAAGVEIYSWGPVRTEFGTTVSSYDSSDSPINLTADQVGVIRTDASGGNIIVNLPPANAVLRFVFSRLDDSANTVTIKPSAGDTIDGNANVALLTQLQLISDGVNKWIQTINPSGAITVGGDWTFSGDPNFTGTPKINGTPFTDAFKPQPGTLAWWPTDTPPTGALVRDGSSLSRTTYADLFAVIGTDYGSDNAYSFNLPDDRNQFIRGQGSNTGVVGTTQQDMLKSHSHGYYRHEANGGRKGGDAFADWNNGYQYLQTADSGGTETRPMNRAYLPIIWY